MARTHSRILGASSAQSRRAAGVRSQRASRRPADRDTIRIVPLVPRDVPTPSAVAAPPHLTYRNGPLLGAVEVFTVFWGTAWASAAQKPIAAKLNAFFDAILSSALIDQLAEYSVAGTPIRHGRRIGSASIATGLPSGSV